MNQIRTAESGIFMFREIIMSINTSSCVVSAGVLADALKKFKNIVPKPISYGPAALRDNILLCHTQDYKLCLYAWDGENSLRVAMNVAGASGLSNLVVSYSCLVAAVSAFKHEDLLLYMSDTLNIRGQSDGGMVECLSTCPVDEYPSIAEPGDEVPLVFHASEFLDALASVAPCLVTSGNRYAMQYVNIAAKKTGGVEMVASDSHRMAVYGFPGVTGHLPEVADLPANPDPKAKAEEQDMTGINGKAVSWLLRHAARGGDITIRFGKKHATITGADWMLVSRLFDGRFPRYRAVLDDIPDLPGHLVVKRAELLDTFKKARTAAREESYAVTLAAANSGEALDVYCKTSERVIYTATIPAASRKFPGFTAQCNYLIDMLVAFPDELFEFRFPARNESGFILAQSGSMVYLLSPMGGLDTTKPDYLAALVEPDQDYPGVFDTHPATLTLSKRPPPFKAVVKRALADVEYKRTLLEALGVLDTVA